MSEDGYVVTNNHVIDGQPLGLETGRLREDHTRLARSLFGTA